MWKLRLIGPHVSENFVKIYSDFSIGKYCSFVEFYLENK